MYINPNLNIDTVQWLAQWLHCYGWCGAKAMEEVNNNTCNHFLNPLNIIDNLRQCSEPINSLENESDFQLCIEFVKKSLIEPITHSLN